MGVDDNRREGRGGDVIAPTWSVVYAESISALLYFSIDSLYKAVRSP